MILHLTLMPTIPHMHSATIEYLHMSEGQLLPAGGKLLDFSVDLGAAFAQECPPISFHRIVVREPAWLRRLEVARGDTCDLGALIAVFSKGPDDDLAEPPTRIVRTNSAAIAHHDRMWTDGRA